MHIKNIFSSFQMIVETKENSIFDFACISDNMEEFSRENIVKIETIKIENIVIFVEYHGINTAINMAKNNIIIHKISLRLRIFHIILLQFFSSLLISLIAIV